MADEIPPPPPRGTPAGEFAQFLQDLTGKTRERPDLLDVFYSAYAVSFFTSLYDAFFIKSTGGADETGHKWQDVSPRTKAYSRKNVRRFYDIPNANPKRPSLTAEEDRIWRTIFVRQLRKKTRAAKALGTTYRKARTAYLQRTFSQGANKDAASEAAAYAWTVLKNTYGAKTLMDILGDENLPIMKSTGDLINSYRPGSGVPYAPVKNQYFRVTNGKISLGTTLPYAIHAFKNRRLIPSGNNLWHRRAMRDGLDAVRARLQGKSL